MLLCDAAAGATRAACDCRPTRRGLLGGALLGGLAAGGGRGAAAQPAPGRVDVHHHLTPPAYLSAIRGVRDRVPYNPPNETWTLARTLEDMERGGVATAVLSITAPGLWVAGDQAAVLARACNEHAAGLVRDNPGRLGSFAALPLPDIDASLREIAYSLDTLGAHGIGLFTNYDGKWLGDPHFAPVFDELNRRRAVVYTHPVSAACCVDLLQGIPDTVVEYGTDTTRSIASLVFSGATTRWPDLRFIFSHAGGTMPFLIERFEFLAERNPVMAARLPGGIRQALARWHYDTAQVANPTAMGALLSVVPSSQVVFGTDYPFRTTEEHVRGLRNVGLSAPDLQAIESGNARRLLPRLAA